jgi:NADPH-dependent curcumin reductase CurA
MERACGFRYQEHRYNGLDSTCHALVDVLTGKNEGKAVIIVADERNAA